jgi:ABC-type multidrug transport system permease subunit
MARLSRVLETIKINLRHVSTFYYQEASRVSVWWLWNLPFHIFQILFSLLLFKYYAMAFGGSSPLYGVDFMTFIISGLMINTYMDSSLTVYYESISALYLGKMGIGGLHLSRRDYLRLAGISPYTFMLARISWRYLMETLMFVLYFVAGTLLFGFQVSTKADLALVFGIILLGIIACSGLGLIPASMYWIAGSYRGVEPITWLVRIITPLAAGIYVPRDILPEALKIAGDLLPQTYTVSAVREVLLEGATLPRITHYLVILIIQTLILVPVGILLLKFSLSLERKRATIY